MAVEIVEIGGKRITIVGTAHVSKKSITEVKEVIAKEKPDSVAIELCRGRYEQLISGDGWQDMKINEILKSGKSHMLLLHLILMNFQRRIGDELGVKPGEEMLEAAKSAEKIGSNVVFADRPVEITMQRMLSMMGTREKIRVLFHLLAGMFETQVDEELIEKMKEKDVITEAIETLSGIAPSAKKALIDERDSYMAARILEAKGDNIVAVVGAGHVEGIKNLLERGVLVKVSSGPKTQEKRISRLRIVMYAIPVLFLGMIGYGLYTGGAELTLRLLLWWFLINGTLSAIGTAAAFGHPITIITAFLAAPFTSLNPMIAAGWVAGYVEALVRVPRVRDLDGLGKLNNWKGFWKNRVTRILLVVVLANLGSSIGTFVALPYLLTLLS
ncbi:TPA: TraB/GumN family protein [archaeon]|jgi:pheromone shutdown-related protein TraB|uniref:TraB/GumN family protein n=1 Tax=Candidatus Undinarchaeum marinum TaxID=2756141 RepID=A0A832ULL3_9ARCH|nr:TraB/GumN family protein [Candidatus Undinarchaeum marinum]